MHSSAELTQLLDELHASRGSDDMPALMALDTRVHRFIYRLSGNPFLEETLYRYFNLSLRIWYLVIDRLPHMFQRVHEHEPLLEAIAAATPSSPARSSPDTSPRSRARSGASCERRRSCRAAAYDYVIVGGGAAGCVLAARLSEDPSTRVLVLEAGRTDYLWDVYIHMPAALSFPIGNRFYDWKYESEPEPHMHGRRIYHARGKVLGGSSSINGMIFQRGNPLDYERWGADPGLEQWDYAHCLPYFKRMETCLAGADEWRGGDGPAEARARPGHQPAVRRLLRGRAAGGLRADRPTSTATARRASRPLTARSTAVAG